MKNFTPLFFLFVFTFCITACSPRYYTPDTHNIPLISKKGETNIAVSGSTDRVEFQASHGITPQIAFKANGGFFFPNDFGNFDYDPSLGNENSGSGKFIEFGAGYFKQINENWIFETYGIFGMGSMESEFFADQTFDIDAEGMLSTKIRRFGIQPNIGYKNDDFIFGASLRLVNLSFYDIEGNLVYQQIRQQDYLRENNSHFLAEPGVVFGITFDKFSIRAHGGLSLNITDINFQQYKSSLSFIANFCF